MDHQAWTEHVRSFMEDLHRLPGEVDVTIEVAPIIDGVHIDSIAERWPTGLPNALRQLWSEGSARINCRYIWTPPPNEQEQLNDVFGNSDYLVGGPRFEEADQIYPGNSGADPDDDLIAETLGEEGLDLWCRSAIFLHVGNGDCLGLDPTMDAADPPVVYLVHDGPESSMISPSLSAFLIAWQELFYIGPESWLLAPWIDSHTGEIDVSKHKTATLRRLLTPRTR